jgi:hypothetical protein
MNNKQLLGITLGIMAIHHFQTVNQCINNGTSCIVGPFFLFLNIFCSPLSHFSPFGQLSVGVGIDEGLSHCSRLINI